MYLSFVLTLAENTLFSTEISKIQKVRKQQNCNGNASAEAVESSLSPDHVGEEKMKIHVQDVKEGQSGSKGWGSITEKQGVKNSV